MKTLVYAGFLVLLFSACGSSKSYLERNDQDKALQDAVKKLAKSPTDADALDAIPILYKDIQNNRLAKIKVLQNDKDLGRWDKIIKEYENLQDAYDAIINNAAAFKLLTPVSYSTNIYDARQSAALEYYNTARQFLDKGRREDSKKAYTYFIKSDKLVPGFKDADAKAEEAYESAIVDVVVNPIQDNSFFYNSGWGNSGYNYSNEYFQQNLVRDLNNVNKQRYPARFYTDWEARRDNIKPDWVVDLKLRNIDIPYPYNYTFSRNASAQVQIGTDTSGSPVYKNVYATVNITRSSFTARADMDMNIVDAATGKNIVYRNVRESYNWQQERGTYNGDSRALSSRDWEVINNAGYRDPMKQDVLTELFRKIYPQVKNNITYAVDW